MTVRACLKHLLRGNAHTGIRCRPTQIPPTSMDLCIPTLACSRAVHHAGVRGKRVSTPIFTPNESVGARPLSSRILAAGRGTGSLLFVTAAFMTTAAVNTVSLAYPGSVCMHNTFMSHNRLFDHRSIEIVKDDKVFTHHFYHAVDGDEVEEEEEEHQASESSLSQQHGSV